MRFTIRPETGKELVLHEKSYVDDVGYWLMSSRLRGWFETPSAREQPTAGATTDGDWWPVRLTQGARVLTIPGLADCESSIEAAKAIDELNALFGQNLEVIGEDARGTRVVTGYLSESPTITVHANHTTFEFDLTITCPDPKKYGELKVSKPVGNYFKVINEGNTNAWPAFDVTGATYFRVEVGDKIVSWSGSGDLHLDFADMQPNVGTVGIDNAFSIVPGTSYIQVATDGEAVCLFRSAWR